MTARNTHPKPPYQIQAAPATSGSREPFRFTQQRRVVFEAIENSDDHPTAADLYSRVQEALPSISLATVYNCLETLSTHGLVRQVNMDRAATRYCLNDRPHAHFHCDGCGRILDVSLPSSKDIQTTFQLPPECVLVQQEITLRGLCPDCSNSNLNSTSHS